MLISVDFKVDCLKLTNMWRPQLSLSCQFVDEIEPF